jgi:hypothetical protein
MKYWNACIGLFVLIEFFGCTWHSGNDIIPGCNTVADTISFNESILPVFNAYCSISGCHSGSAPAGNLNLEPSMAYTKLMQKGKGYIDTINPKNSVLYNSLTSANEPMPPSGRLDPCTLESIQKWMLQKAKNN